MLKEPDRVSVLLQAIPNEVRQYVVLHHGKSGRWDELVDSCKLYEQQLRMVDAAPMRQWSSRFFVFTAARKGMLRKIAGNGSENAVVKGDSKGKSKRWKRKRWSQAQRG